MSVVQHPIKYLSKSAHFPEDCSVRREQGACQQLPCKVQTQNIMQAPVEVTPLHTLSPTAVLEATWIIYI